MFCSNCGAQIPDGSRFCNKCGSAIEHADVASEKNIANTQSGPAFTQDPSLPEGIFRDESGAYHWIYSMDMMRNPVPLFTIMKIFCVICICLGVFAGFSAFQYDHDLMDALKAFAMPAIGINAFFFVISLISWGIMMAMHKGRYVYEFLMTEDKVVTLQTEEERTKTEKLSKFALVLSIIDANPTMAGAGLAALAGTVFTSEYKEVKTVIAAPKQDLIKVNNVLQRNTIYAEPHQYEFVWNYITEHCPNARISG